jgi:hypothetical protein
MRDAKRIGAVVAVGLLIASLSIGAGTLQAATINIINMNDPGEGFNDPTPATPVGGNPGTTLGQQRLNAFTYAANLWGQVLASDVTIDVEASMDSLYCDATSAVLGSAGTNTVHRDFTGAPQSGTWYCQALANSLHGSDLSSGDADISATFNSELNGDAGCLGGIGWYYGYDGNPSGDIDFVSIVFHEIAHGLGFQTFIGLTTGTKFYGYDDQYELFMERHFATPPDYPSMTNYQRALANKSDPDLHWVGSTVNTLAPSVLSAGISNGHVRLYGPDPVEPGSSLSHWSTACSPNLVMEPIYTGPNHDGTMELALFEDIGWQLVPPPEPMPLATHRGIAVLAVLALATAAFLLMRRGRAAARA